MAKNEIKYLTAIKADKRVKKFCRFKKYKIRYIDYKDVEFLKKELKKVPSMDGLELASAVSTTTPYFLGDEKSK